MYRLQLTLLLAFLGASALMAEDAEPDKAPQQATPADDAAAPEDTVSDQEIDELLGLDDDYSEADDDDFDPTKDVRFEQSIPFPTDI